MKPEARDAVLLELLARLDERGSWCGETHLQKAAYFLQETQSVPLGFEFVLYRHGPYSFGLSDALADVRGNLLLESKTRATGYGPSLVETELGEVYRSRFPKTIDQYNGSIGTVARFVGNRNVSELERLATALYVTRSDPSGTLPTRAATIVHLKPHITVEAATDALVEVERFVAEHGA